MKRLFRAEQGAVAAYNLIRGTSVSIMGKNLEKLESWLCLKNENEISKMLVENGFVDQDISVEDVKRLKSLVEECKEVKSPPRSKRVPEIMNIELTNRCPLKCPQCYCDLDKGDDIDKDTAFKYVENAARLKIPFINLSGGETMAYPHLTELIQLISEKGLSCAIAVSGWGIDEEKLDELKNAGVDGIYVSLNGSTKEVNSLSRDGYELAIRTLELLRDGDYPSYYINWVARNDNVEDFPRLVKLAEEFNVKGIAVIKSKPDASYVMQATLNSDNFSMLAEFLKGYKSSSLKIEIEPCFSELRAVVGNYGIWNSNRGINKGCGAGRNAMAVDVKGNLIPCRHLLHPEKYESIEDYWNGSKLLESLRRFEDNIGEPCKSCSLRISCIPCRAVADKVEGDIFSGDRYCPVGETER